MLRNISFALIIVIGVAGLVSCKKEDTAPEEKPDPVDTTTITGNFYKKIRVENFATDTTNQGDYTGTKNTVYFSLENNKGMDEKYAKTIQWDLAFSGIASAFLSANNGSNNNNYGYGTRGQGGIAILAKSFEEVTELPVDQVFNTNKNIIGLDDGGSFGSGIGWCLYDWDGTIMADGSYDKGHVAYALANRTILLRTANGNYAKIKMISIYKDAFTYDQMFRKTPHPYFTFEYVMIPKNETKFVIK